MRDRLDVVRLLAYAGPRLIAAQAAAELLNAVLPLAVIGAIGVLVERATTDGAIAGPLAIVTFLLLSQHALAPLRGTLTYWITRRVDGALRGRVMRAANRPLGIQPLEDPEVLDRLALAGGDIDTFWTASPGGAAASVMSLAGRYLQAFGATLILARFSPLLAAGLFLIVVVGRACARRWNAARVRARRASLAPFRAARYTASLATAPPAAKETRLFGLVDWLLGRHSEQWFGTMATLVSARRRLARRLVVLLVVVTPFLAVVFVAIGRSDLEARSLAVALQAILAVFALSELRTEEFQLDFGLESLHALRQVETELDRPPAPAAAAPAAAATTGPTTRPTTPPTTAATGLPARVIRFEGVCFAYPGSDRQVFDGLDLTIPAGASLAIVGVNGAGKTTLIKLLARLYDPDTGRITVDGTDLASLDPESWRRRLAVIFQDFVHYELSAADNVGFGGLPLASAAQDRAALRTAAAKAGALDVVERLPAAWDTPLSRQYQGGADLSGGQWQRVALARALFAVEAGAGVLVLDEPTANLDVRAEAELFDRFLELTAGLTTILISHRFSTVRRADRICVLEGGRVAEVGTHGELAASGGRYAEMFALQAARFHA